jgi:hypothetical protein
MSKRKEEKTDHIKSSQVSSGEKKRKISSQHKENNPSRGEKGVQSFI